MIYPITPHIPYKNSIQKKTLLNILEEESLFHQINNIQTQTTAPGHPNSVFYYTGVYLIPQFLATPSSSYGPTTIQFLNTSLYPVESLPSFTWNFGDGTTGVGKNPTHHYENTGSYDVELTMSNVFGFSKSIRTNNAVFISLPSITASYTQNSSSNLNSKTIVFQNTSEYNEPTTPTYFWEFGDGNTSTEINPSHIYESAGIYTASLHATSSYNQTSKYTESFVVLDPKPELVYSVSESIIRLIENTTPTTTSYRLFSSVNNDTKIYSRNDNLWLTSSIDVTCIPAITGNETTFDGVLIAPDILLQANHAHTNGMTYFVNRNNQTFSSSIVSGSQVGTTDIWISRLNPPLTSSIRPAKILPSSSFYGNNRQILDEHLDNRTIPSVFTNQYKEMFIGSIFRLSGSVFIVKPTANNLIPWYSPIIGGDSGASFFMLINDELVVLGTWFASNFSSLSTGPSVSSYESQINQVIASLGSTSSLSIVNLSKFLTY